jgi:hypothetical protein
MSALGVGMGFVCAEFTQVFVNGIFPDEAGSWGSTRGEMSGSRWLPACSPVPQLNRHGPGQDQAARASRYVPTWAAPEGQQRLSDRAQHVAWLAGAQRPDFRAVAVLRVAAGATMRQACTAAGIDHDAPLVGIPAAAF